MLHANDNVPCTLPGPHLHTTGDKRQCGVDYFSTRSWFMIQTTLYDLHTRLRELHREQSTGHLGHPGHPGHQDEPQGSTPSSGVPIDQVLQEVQLEPAFEEALGRCLALMAGPEVAELAVAAAKPGRLLHELPLGLAAVLAQVMVSGGAAAQKLLLEKRCVSGWAGAGGRVLTELCLLSDTTHMHDSSVGK
jgi:hypothetical protein